MSKFELVKQYLHEKTMANQGYFLVYNLGISGDTSEDILERFEFETKQRIKEDEETMFILSVGPNDTQFFQKENRLRVSPEKFRENLLKLIDIAKRYSQKVACFGSSGSAWILRH